MMSGREDIKPTYQGTLRFLTVHLVMLWYASYIINKVTSGSNVATKKQDTHIYNCELPGRRRKDSIITDIIKMFVQSSSTICRSVVIRTSDSKS